MKKRGCNVAVRSLTASDFIRMATLGLLPDVALAPAGPENMAPCALFTTLESGLGECAPCQHLSESPGGALSLPFQISLSSSPVLPRSPQNRPLCSSKPLG